MGDRDGDLLLSRAVTFSAPTRVDLAGGTLDIWPVGLLVDRAATVNVAITLRAKATVRFAPEWRVVNPQRGLDIEAEEPESLFRHPFTALGGRLAAFFAPDRPVEVRFETTAPPGSGLGGSSALGMAMAGALNRLCDAGWSVPELVQIVMDTEVRILRTSTGAQDQLAAGLGGAHAHHWESPAPRSEPLPWSDGGADPLATRFVLAYTGESHSSAEPNRKVLDRILAGEPKAVSGTRAIAEAAISMREALLAGDWGGVARSLDSEWTGRRDLSEAVTTPGLDRFEAALRRAGAEAVKACGAGAGGTLLAMVPPDAREAVAAAAGRAGGAALEARSDPDGLRREADEVPG